MLLEYRVEPNIVPPATNLFRFSPGILTSALPRFRVWSPGPARPGLRRPNWTQGVQSPNNFRSGEGGPVARARQTTQRTCFRESRTTACRRSPPAHTSCRPATRAWTAQEADRRSNRRATGRSVSSMRASASRPCPRPTHNPDSKLLLRQRHARVSPAELHCLPGPHRPTGDPMVRLRAPHRRSRTAPLRPSRRPSLAATSQACSPTSRACWLRRACSATTPATT